MKKKTVKKKVVAKTTTKENLRASEISETLKVVESIYKAPSGLSPQDFSGFVTVVKRNDDGTWFMSSSAKNTSIEIVLHSICNVTGMTYLECARILIEMSNSQEEKKSTESKKK